MELLSFSARTISDIKRAVEILPPEKWNLKLVVREFVQIPIEMEFRGFVYKGQLNAVSQYYSDCFFSNLLEKKTIITQRIQEFFKNVKSKISYDNYIIDFVVLEDSIKIIEMNPYTEKTGSALFNWNQDKNTIEGGPFELRLNVETKSDKILEALLIGWKHLVNEATKDELSTSSSNSNENTLSTQKKCTIS